MYYRIQPRISLANGCSAAVSRTRSGSVTLNVRAPTFRAPSPSFRAPAFRAPSRSVRVAEFRVQSPSMGSLLDESEPSLDSLLGESVRRDSVRRHSP